MKEAVSVTQLNRYIKEMFYDDNILNNVIVKGEVSNFKKSKENYYFSLKDDFSNIQCIIFSNSFNVSDSLDKVTDGSQVIVQGKVAVYEKNGTYSIYVSSIEHSGLGEYYLKLEELKKKLFEMGMFDDSYKKEIPKYALNIGVVTAENGAAIRDIYKTIKNKNPYANITLYPSLVQGDNAYLSIVDGIMTLDKMDLDVIIVGRGGGSIEDLYCFNDERVAYAIFNAKTPIISAVGHEINDSISDLVADARAATPTAAGELATFSYADFENVLENYKSTIESILQDKINIERNRLDNFNLKIQSLSPITRLERYKDLVKYNNEQLNKNILYKITFVKNKLNKYIDMLKSRDILDKLSKGLSYNTNVKGKKITTVKNIKVGDEIMSRMKDGSFLSVVKKIYKKS